MIYRFNNELNYFPIMRRLHEKGVTLMNGASIVNRRNEVVRFSDVTSLEFYVVANTLFVGKRGFFKNNPTLKDTPVNTYGKAELKYVITKRGAYAI